MSIAPCSNTPPVLGVVVFDPAAFILRYPEFAATPPALLQMYFAEATLYLNNGCCSRVQDAAVREVLLNMLVAHIAWLNGQGEGNPGANPSMVGRISSATEGSVSVQSQYASNTSQSMAFFTQTKYGAAYWQATARWRTMVYIPPVNPCCGPGFGPYGMRGF